MVGADAKHAYENDGLNWPHCDVDWNSPVLNWPHLPLNNDAARDLNEVRAARGVSWPQVR